MILVPAISPVAFTVLGLSVRWYAIAYIAGFIVGFWLLKRMFSASRHDIMTSARLDNLLTAIILGVIIGGRLGYVLFYNLPFFIAHPIEILMIWHGGMSFHGGLLGVIIAVFIFSYRLKTKTAYLKPAFYILDALAVVAPIGLFFGRIANFINMEIMGRATNGALGVVFVDKMGAPIGPSAQDAAAAGALVPRFPSPLIEASLEGIALFAIMFLLWRFTRLRERVGALSGIFAMLYAVFRIIGEQFRQPDAQLGFLLGTNWLTMGMVLSGIMFVVGLIIFALTFNKKIL